MPWNLSISAMATLWRFLTLLALLGLSLAVRIASSSVCNMVTWLTSCSVPQLPSVDSAGAVDSRIDARNENATVVAVDCANDGPWGSADGRRLKQFADIYGPESGYAYGISAGKQNRCYQLACLGSDSVPGIIWACLRERTLIVSST